MTNTPIWEVTLYVYGPITVDRYLNLNAPKGFRLADPFYSDVNIRSSKVGIDATVTAYASTGELARKAALLFFGQMLDALALQIDRPLNLSLNGTIPIRAKIYDARRRVEKDEWQEAFREARLLALTETTFLRALSWYRKGLNTEDPFDKFLAFWNSIEIVVSKYHPPIPEGKATGIISQTWESFKDIWGECEHWPVINSNMSWIDDNYNVRLDIAHGIKPIGIETVEFVLAKLDTINQVACTFLKDWRRTRLNPQIPVELENLFGY